MLHIQNNHDWLIHLFPFSGLAPKQRKCTPKQNIKQIHMLTNHCWILIARKSSRQAWLDRIHAQLQCRVVAIGRHVVDDCCVSYCQMLLPLPLFLLFVVFLVFVVVGNAFAWHKTTQETKKFPGEEPWGDTIQWFSIFQWIFQTCLNIPPWLCWDKEDERHGKKFGSAHVSPHRHLDEGWMRTHMFSSMEIWGGLLLRRISQLRSGSTYRQQCCQNMMRS